VLSDPHIETYEKKDGGMGFKLAAKVDSLEFASSPDTPRQEPAPKPGIEGLEDDIPF
jgi:hypothetical protein